MTVRSAVSLLLLLAGAMAGCATTPFGPAALDAGDRPRRSTSRERDMAAEAYYHYTVAQMAADGVIERAQSQLLHGPLVGQSAAISAPCTAGGLNAYSLC